MKQVENTYGLILRRYQEHGYECLTAELIRREGDHHAPRNISDDWSMLERPKHLVGLALEGLCLDGFVNSTDRHSFVCGGVMFKGVHQVDENRARRMLKTLKKVNTKISADSSYTPEDQLVSLCHALRLSFVVESRDRYGASSYDDNSWRWMTIGEGRNRYRQLIVEMTRKELVE